MLSMIKITDYSEGNEDTTVKFETKVIKSKLQDYSDAYILVTGDIMPPHPLSNFEIQKYYENEARFNGVYSRKFLPKK